MGVRGELTASAPRKTHAFSFCIATVRIMNLQQCISDSDSDSKCLCPFIAPFNPLRTALGELEPLFAAPMNVFIFKRGAVNLKQNQEGAESWAFKARNVATSDEHFKIKYSLKSL